MERTLKPNPIKVNKTTLIQLENGKLPPQAVDVEEAVLGAMMIDKKGIDEVIDVLSPDAFYKEQHQLIFKAIVNLFHTTPPQPIDLLTVSAELKKMGALDLAGGDYYLIQLTQKIASSAHITFHARIILQKHIQRSLISISSNLIEDCYDETMDVFDLLDTAESNLYEITQGNLKKSYESAQDLVIQAKKKIEEIANREEGFSGIPTGFTKLDDLTSGWQASDLIIIAARPGMGKTAFVLSMARNIAIQSKSPVAIFSLEMSSVQLITRMISSETHLSSEKLRKGNLEPHEWQQLNAKVTELEKAPIFIDDTPSLSIFDLRAKARRLATQHGVKIIIIDYLQLMSAGGKGGGNREQEISIISRNLKGLAKELNIPVIALSQLSRAVETRNANSKRPLLSDLRESGAIEQDADIVSFIYRPEYYKIDTWDDEEQSPTAGTAEFIIAKHRNGSLDNIRLKFEGQFGRFANLEEFRGSFEEVMHSKINNEDSTQSFNAFGSTNDAFGLNQNSNNFNAFDENDDNSPF